MKKILLYGINEIDADLYQNVAIGYDVAMYILNDTCMSVLVRDLFELNDDLDNMHAEAEGEYMLMDGISSEDLIVLLKAFEDAGRPFKGTVIVRTRINETWTLAKLLDEVREEHVLMEKLNELDEMLQDCNGIDLSAMDASDSTELKAALLEGYLLLKDDQQELAEVDEAIRRLRKAMEPAVKIVH
ncbi:MAG: DUF3783 domain-containing protein [Solobacterium sp.]|jgi:hypothetical protein|nr:DUF3783 domain-containing protein [Solobacterium sp.]